MTFHKVLIGIVFLAPVVYWTGLDDFWVGQAIRLSCGLAIATECSPERYSQPVH
jgi:hypothetical protein